MDWLPAATRSPMHEDGFPWQVDCPTKGVLHTTESPSWPDYPSQYEPHLTVLPHPGRGVEIRQHIALTKAAYALKHPTGTASTNGAHALQMELVGTCDPSGPHGAYFWPDADDAVLTDLYAKVIKPLGDAFGIPLHALPFLPYPQSYGASTVRLNGHQWLSYSGWCFDGYVLVTTSTGQVPISEVQIGDLVLTDQGRFRPVTAVHRRMANTYTMIGQGHPGLRTTAEHPFLSVTSTMGRRKVAQDPNRAHELVYSEPEWVEAQDMPGRYWATPIAFPESEPPPVVPIRGKGKRNFPAMSPELLRLAGRYTADGHLGQGGRIVISARPDEEAEVTDLILAAGLPAVSVGHRDRGALQIAAFSVSLVAWLREHFGVYAHEKSLPSWLLGADEKYREAFWQGYMDGDGHLEPEGRFEAKTSSKKLAIGLRLLATSLGYGTTLYLLPARTAQPFPDGRVCDIKPQWRVKGSKVFGRGTATKVIGGHRYSRVKSISPDEGGPVTVFNLTVAEDNTYVADGIVVHNCGHEHVPGNTHGDPGAFPWGRLAQLAQGDDMPLTDDDAVKVARAVHNQLLFGSDVTIGRALYDLDRRPAPSAADIAAALTPALVAAVKALPAGTVTLDDATLARLAAAVWDTGATRLVR